MNKSSEQDVIRYSKAIELAMNIVWMRASIIKAETEIKRLLTYAELIDGDYQNASAKEAFNRAAVGVTESRYCGSACTFNGVEVLLHQAPDELTGKAINNVIVEAKIKR